MIFEISNLVLFLPTILVTFLTFIGNDLMFTIVSEIHFLGNTDSIFKCVKLELRLGYPLIVLNPN